MSTEELMKPRYKVIADYPVSPYEIGEIILPEATPNPNYTIEKLNKYPHLFKPLQWWEERLESDMPEYVKFSDDKNTTLSVGKEVEPEIHKIKHHWTTSPKMDFYSSSYNAFISEWKNHCYSYAQFLPSTFQEHEDYINSK